MTSADTWLMALVVIAVAMVNDCAAEAQEWTADEVTVSRHCVSERSFAESGDCRVIAWIDRRNAERRGLTIGEWMASAHSRHLRSPSRPWLAELNAEGTAPVSWPAGLPWAPAQRIWFATLAVVRDVLSGGSHGCDGVPLVWGSPTHDRSRLDRWYARGFDRLTCGGGTRNEIVGRR